MINAKDKLMNKQNRTSQNQTLPLKICLLTKLHRKWKKFIAGPSTETSRMVSEEITHKVHDEYTVVFTGCFEDTFSLQVKDDAKPYKVLPR